MSIKWNRIYTDLLRGSQSTLWGNWALNGHIQPGAVGMVDASSGNFTPVNQMLPGAKTSAVHQDRKWKLSSEHVVRRELKSSFAGTLTDPTTGLEIKPDAEIEWAFNKKESIISEFAISGEERLGDLTEIQRQYAWLYEQAQHMGMASDGAISQGFGVVTHVIYASSGINAGSKVNGAKFSMIGRASALSTLLGEKNANIKADTNFLLSREQSSVETHTLPAESGMPAIRPMPVAYGFASFAGRLLIPHWVAKLGALKLHIDSKATSMTTYSTKVRVSYNTPGGRVERVATVVGGSSASFNDIPLHATQLRVEAEFINIGDNQISVREWNSPLAQWTGGNRTIHLKGTWPGTPQMSVVEED